MLHLSFVYARLAKWVLKLGTKRTNVCASPPNFVEGVLRFFMLAPRSFSEVGYNYYSFFLCVESGRTHKDIRLELAPLSARGRKYPLKYVKIGVLWHF